MRLTRALSLALSVVVIAAGALAPRSVDASPDTTRVRKNWEQLSATQRAVYLEAVGDAMQSGKHLTFTKIYMDASGLEHVRATCGAPAWYRKWLYGYESMLRSLDAKYADVTLPYWNFFHDSAKRMSSRSSCNNVQSCSKFLSDFGGSDGDDYELPFTIGGEFVAGNCVRTGIAQYGCTDPNGSANCEKCIPRGDWDVDQSTFEFGASAFPEVLRHASKSATPFETLRDSMQTRFHWNLHNLLGGVYETRAAAFDPIFIGHYAMIDQIYHLFQGCHKNSTLTGSCKMTDGQDVSPSSTIPMQLDGQAVEDHPDTAAYFTGVGTTYADLETATDYEVDPFLEILLREFSGGRCTPESAPTLTWAKTNSMVDTNVTEGFAHAMALCASSKLTGNTSDEAPYTAVTCELMARAQNGAFTNFSTPIRETFKAPAHLLPSCIDILAAVATDTIQLEISADCKAAILKETGESTTDFVVRTSGFAVITRGVDGGVKYLKGLKSKTPQPQS